MTRLDSWDGEDDLYGSRRIAARGYCTDVRYIPCNWSHTPCLAQSSTIDARAQPAFLRVHPASIGAILYASINLLLAHARTERDDGSNHDEVVRQIELTAHAIVDVTHVATLDEIQTDKAKHAVMKKNRVNKERLNKLKKKGGSVIGSGSLLHKTGIHTTRAVYRYKGREFKEGQRRC